MTTWFTSDQHLCHVNIIRHCDRPFANVSEMNEAIVANHNAVVKPDDTVWHLGDFFWGNPKDLAWWLSRFNGKHYLVPGNHDGCHHCHSKSRREVTRYLFAGFQEVVTEFMMTLPGVGLVMLNHFPLRQYAGDDARYLEHRPQELHGAKWLLCGHVHEKWKRLGPCVNVGVDQWAFSPVSAEQLAGYIKGLESKS